MIPLAELITPQTPVGQGLHGGWGTSLGEAGQMMADTAEKDRLFKQKQLEDLARWQDEAAGRGIQREHVEGTNRYYDAQAETHRMGVDEKNRLEAEKRANVLFDAFRKAKTPPEREAIRQELARNGFNVSEHETDLPAEPGTENPPAPTGPKEPDVKGAAQDWWTALSAPFKAGGGDAEAAKDSAGGASASSLMPWDLLGFGDQKKPAPETPKRGGKFVVTDKTGNTVLTYDEPVQRVQARQHILDAAAGLIDHSRTPENKQAATRAADVAAAALDATGDSKYALDTFLKTYQAETSQFKKAPVAGVGGTGGGGPSKTAIKLEGMDREATNQIITRVARDEHTKAAADTEQDAIQGLKLIQDMNSGTGDFGAFSQYLKSMSGKVVTDREREQFQGSEGIWTELENKSAKYFNNGRYAPEYMHELEKVLLLTLQRAREARVRASKIAQGEARGLGLTPEAVDVVGGHFTGDFAAEAPKPLSTKGAAKGPKSSTPVGNSPDDAELIRRWKATHGQ